jgi:BirA family biotin operon repressor/biotin-[acetyl-CoA-carboxylase] ligase
MIASELLAVDAIRARLTGRTIGRQLYLFGAVDSTNAKLRALARSGAAEGTAVLAEGQTAGRGRRGQPWFSPSGVNLYASVLFRPPLPPREIGVFSFIASLALSDVVRAHGVDVAIKWPNDVLVGGRKIGGALMECGMRGEAIDHVIAGVGANLNVEAGVLRAALGKSGLHATSLSAVTGREIDRNVFAAAFLNALDAWYETWRLGGAGPILHAWRDRDILTGRRVEIRGVRAAAAGAAEPFEARVLGIDAAGGLVVRNTLGVTQTLVSDEVRILD